jgi:hypothetical protein
MRVVQDAGNVRSIVENEAPVAKPVAAPPPPKTGLPLMPAILFLLACIGGGVAIAMIRPFGLG